MSSGTSIKGQHLAGSNLASDAGDGGRNMTAGTKDDPDALQPWQLFTLAGLAGATAVVFVTKETGPASVILLSITVGASAWVGLTSWRTLAPIFGVHRARVIEVVAGRTRVALEREKTLVLRSIKDLEFDRAMGKVAEKDFVEMSARLRARATGLLRQLDRSGYRDEIEKEIARRIGGSAGTAGTKVPAHDDRSAATKVAAHDDRSAATKVAAYEDPPAVGPNFSSGDQSAATVGPNFSSGDQSAGDQSRTCACGTINEADARFCKQCGSRLAAA